MSACLICEICKTCWHVDVCRLPTHQKCSSEVIYTYIKTCNFTKTSFTLLHNIYLLVLPLNICQMCALRSGAHVWRMRRKRKRKDQMFDFILHLWVHDLRGWQLCTALPFLDLPQTRSPWKISLDTSDMHAVAGSCVFFSLRKWHFVAPRRTKRHHRKVKWFISAADFYHSANMWINAGTNSFYCFTGNNPP